MSAAVRRSFASLEIPNYRLYFGGQVGDIRADRDVCRAVGLQITRTAGQFVCADVGRADVPAGQPERPRNTPAEPTGRTRHDDNLVV